MNRRGFFGMLVGVVLAARSPRRYWRLKLTGATNAAPIANPDFGDWVSYREIPVWRIESGWSVESINSSLTIAHYRDGVLADPPEFTA